MWEKIKLSKNYTRALEQINSHLEYFPTFLLHKCKQRLTKMTQYLIRMRKLKLKVRPKLIGIHKKLEKRESKRELKAEKAAKLSTSIEKELLDRLRKGIYGSLHTSANAQEEAIVNESNESFNRVLDQMEADEEYGVEVDEDALQDYEFEDEFEDDEEMDDEVKFLNYMKIILGLQLDREFVSDISESENEDDIEDFMNSRPSISSSDDDDNRKRKTNAKSTGIPKKKKPSARVEIEYENEDVEASKLVDHAW